MMDWVKKINVNKNDLISISILAFVFFILLPFFWGKWGAVFVDSARELYVPTLVLEGKVLYKDILDLYGPFAYQFNALLYLIFGVNINVLFVAGVVNSLVITICSYSIIRSFSSSLTSFVSALLIMCSLVFRCTYECYANYFFPYSFAIAYSLCFVLLSLCFLLYYLKTEDIKLIYLSLFFTGLALVTKLDFCLFALILIPFFLASKKIELKQKLIGCFILSLPAVVSWGILFYQGVTIKTIEDILMFGHNFFNAPTVKYFNSHFIGGCLTKSIVVEIIEDSSLYLSFFVKFLIFGAIAAFVNLKLKNIPIKISLNLFLVAVLFKYFAPFTSSFYGWMGNGFSDYSWLSYLVLIILFVVLIKNAICCFTKNSPVSLKEKLFLILIITSILTSMRTIWRIATGNIGNFATLLHVAVIVTFFMEILPGYIPKIDKNLVKTIFAITFILLSASYAKNFLYQTKSYTYEFKSSRGCWYMHDDYGTVLTDVIEYMAKNATKNDKVLMIPESPIICYFTGLKTYPKYYSLIPHVIETYGELNILRDLTKDKPDYILINNINYAPFEHDYFGKDFALNIGDFIEKNYTVVKTFPDKDYIYTEKVARKNNFNIKIYKLK